MKEFLDWASKCYYEGNPVLSDEEYDYLESICGKQVVGYSTDSKFKHAKRMYSLQKVFSLDDAPLNISKCVKTPKLDGAAVSLLYVGGVLELALTRGDGIYGIDITEKMRKLVPGSIAADDVCFITGEVVAPKNIPNARNYAAGALNLKSVDEFKSRNLTFVAYDVDFRGSVGSWKRDFWSFCDEAGLICVLSCGLADRFPTDGVVYRLDSISDYYKAGFTSNHPKGAFALKEIKKGIETKLLDVVWQVGKSGAVSPVAIFEPIDIEGATVSRATLHNIEYINALNLELGCRIEVIRSGEIIPRVVKRVD